MRTKLFRCALVAFFAVAASVFAAGAEEENTLPEGVIGHFSFAEPQAFLNGIFSFVGASTKDTGYALPAEVLPVLAAAYSPMPLDGWDMESELHIVLTDNGGESPTMAALFDIKSFDGLLSALEAADWEIEEAEGELHPVFLNARVVSPPSGASMNLFEVAGGQALLAQEGADPGFVAEWAPGHDSDADFVARVRLDGEPGGMLGDLYERLFEQITGDADEIVKAVVDAGMTEEAGRLLADLAAKHGRRAVDEIKQAEELALELSFVDDRLVVGLGMLFADGTWMRKFADTVASQAALNSIDGAVLARLPEGHFISCISTFFAELMRNSMETVTDVLADIAYIDPDLDQDRMDKLLASYSDLFAAGPGPMMSANYLNGGAPYQLMICGYRKPKAALNAIAAMGEVFNDLAAAAFADPSAGISFPRETQSDGGREWYAWRIAPVGEGEKEGFGEFLRKLELDSAAQDGAATAETLLDPDFRIYAAGLEDLRGLIIAAGTLGEEEFAGILQSIADGTVDETSSWNNPDVKARRRRQWEG